MEQQSQKEDLRVRKTKAAIRNTFTDMICEMDYDRITIKELTDRAMINRKTFYLHYQSLDNLLAELQDEIVQKFVSQDISYRSISDIKKSIRYFFEYVTSMPELGERLLCSGSYSMIGEQVNSKIMEYRSEKNRGAFSKDPLEDNLVFAYFASNSVILYRQWVKDGKKMPLEDLIRTATNLICSGIQAYVGK